MLTIRIGKIQVGTAPKLPKYVTTKQLRNL